MKRSIIAFVVSASILSGCSAIQSIVRSTFPYTATLSVPASSSTDVVQSVTAQASSFDQIFTGQGSNTNAITDVRLSSVKLDANYPSGQSFVVFKSIKIYISRGDSSQEQLIATRDNIASTVANSIMLDADTTILLDDYIKESTVRIRMEYVKREASNADITVKVSLGFDAAPNTRK
ncbi:MAG: hypothetical protein ACOYKR_11880 [Sphingobacterium thalpophilum]|jgi:hypothetical protein